MFATKQKENKNKENKNKNKHKHKRKQNMIIPIKCFTCGTVLADKYRYYCEQVVLGKKHKNTDTNRFVYLTSTNHEKTVEGHVLDKMKLYKMCCRRHMLTHVDID